ncbi:MAG: hypothetical protein A3H36_00425 [Chloroflexi bacterium RIFCSPLOWO2_02_FULL_71_16]|nr:MAG: hypothetical protein A2082_04765 [Chloroflexi bacterium GWC2_70_10]OGO70605.1 MAG: hypothetical protein A3H36_00425 [Chloroflexi bacterium RIFCSPLOWO2_02_FULL_71_16]
MADQRIAWAKEIAQHDPIQEGEPFRQRFVHHSDRTSTAVTSIAAGQGIRLHIHRDHDEVVMVAEGELEFRIEGETTTLGAGVVVSVPAGVVHAPAHTREGCVVVSVFAPRFDPTKPDRHFIDDPS